MFSGREGIGIFFVIHEKLVRIFIASVVALALNGLRFLTLGATVPAAMLEFPHGNVFHIVTFGNDATSRFENERVEALFRKFLGGPAAGDSRADYNCVIGCGCHGCLNHSASPAPGPTLMQPCCAPGMICNLSS